MGPRKTESRLAPGLGRRPPDDTKALYLKLFEDRFRRWGMAKLGARKLLGMNIQLRLERILRLRNVWLESVLCGSRTPKSLQPHGGSSGGSPRRQRRTHTELPPAPGRGVFAAVRS